MNKLLVCYFSCSGTTAKVATKIKDLLNCDLFEIKPTEPYTSKDLNWMDKKSRSSLEMNDPSIRVEIKEKVKDISQYDVIFIGFPIWWYTVPNIVASFIESYDLTNKTIVPFCTSGGSGFGKSIDYLKSLAPKAKWENGKVINDGFNEEITNWIKKER